jgi:hypothetical protein
MDRLGRCCDCRLSLLSAEKNLLARRSSSGKRFHPVFAQASVLVSDRFALSSC